MSFIGKKWVIKNENSEFSVIEKLHLNRNLDNEEKKSAFFDDGLENLHDPFLFKDIKIAVERIKKAIENGEKIMVFGDYDVDGITSTVLIYDFLTKVGADAHYTLPNRENDGYGLKDYFIRQFKEDGISLIITVDCGTANVKEVEIANELGIDVIITDHHSIPEVLPPAYAIINANQEDCEYPNKYLSGSGVAYKLLSVLVPYYFDVNDSNAYLYKQLGIATLGLVADCMPLTGENRILTKYGLKSLEDSEHPGISALMENNKFAKGKITSTTIGYYIGPRINAAGRLDTADHSLQLLLGDIEKAVTLDTLNTKRQEIVEQFLSEAKNDVEEFDQLPNLIIVKNPDWHVGTLGLIAGKICDHYNRPTIAMREKDDDFVASCRSLNDFDITAFLRKEAGDLFSAFGGHKMAGGFTLPKKNYDEFVKLINNSADKQINPDEFHGKLEIDCEIAPHEMNFDTCNHMNKLEPFGNGNPEPTLMVKNVKIQGIRPVGSSGEHLQFPVKLGDKRVQAIAFRFGQHLDKIDPNINYDIAFNMEINEWKGYRNLQLKVIDLKQSDSGAIVER